MLDELNEDIVFLCHAIKEDKCTDLHQRYLEAFYEPDNPLLSRQERPMIGVTPWSWTRTTG